MHIMIDIETLGIDPGSIILTIGAIKFDPWSDYWSKAQTGDMDGLDTFYRRIDTESCAEVGMTMHDPTVKWWSEQAPEVTAEAFAEENRKPLSEVCSDLYRWGANGKYFWANGSYFDFPHLEHACRAVGKGHRWSFWQVMDHRTIINLSGVKAPDKLKHHALYDCLNQIVALQQSFKQLNITEMRKPKF